MVYLPKILLSTYEVVYLDPRYVGTYSALCQQQSRTSLSRRVLGSTVGTYHLQPTLLDTESDGGANSSRSSSTAAAWAFYLPTYLPTYLVQVRYLAT